MNRPTLSPKLNKLLDDIEAFLANEGDTLDSKGDAARLWALLTELERVRKKEMKTMESRLLKGKITCNGT